MDGQDFARLVGRYDRFANALDFDSEDARTAEGEFYTLPGNLYEQERAAQTKLDYAAFRRASSCGASSASAKACEAAEEFGEEACATAEMCQRPGMKFDLKFSIIDMMRDRMCEGTCNPANMVQIGMSRTSKFAVRNLLASPSLLPCLIL